MADHFPMRIRTKILPHGMNNPTPHYKRAGDAGMDLYACHVVHLTPGFPFLVDTGICLEIPDGIFGSIRSRSGLATAGVTAFHGTIDPGYRGEVKVLMRFDPLPAKGAYAQGAPYIIEPGDRIAQIVFLPFVAAHLELVDELAPSLRGHGGFGSTGL